MARKRQYDPVFPYYPDADLERWIGGMAQYAERNFTSPLLGDTALLLREKISGLQKLVITIKHIDAAHRTEFVERVRCLAEHIRALRLEADVITLSAELGSAKPASPRGIEPRLRLRSRPREKT